MTTKKNKCSGPCCMCVKCNQEDLSPCDDKGKSDNYQVSSPDDLTYRLDTKHIDKEDRVKIIRYLQENYDIAYRPSLVYSRTLALFCPISTLPNILHEVLYKGNTKYLIHNEMRIADISKITALETYYEDITNTSIIHTLMQEWKINITRFSHIHETELMVSDRINNTFDLISIMIDDVINSYIEVMKEEFYSDDTKEVSDFEEDEK